MKGSRMKIAAALMAAAVTFSGCGTALYEMTPEEQAAIVSYASHTVAKFNNFQKDGEVFVSKDVLEGEGMSQEVKAPSVPAAEPAETLPADGEESSAQDAAPSQTASAAQNTASDTGTAATIGQALDLGVIRADFTGSKLCTTYQKSDSYAVDASSGSQLLVLGVRLTNQSAEDLYIDILAMTPTFQVTVNGEQTAAAQTTILPDDLSTYQGNILAGASNDTVLLFEIPQGITEISDISLRVTMNGIQSTIKL